MYPKPACNQNKGTVLMGILVMFHNQTDDKISCDDEKVLSAMTSQKQNGHVIWGGLY